MEKINLFFLNGLHIFLIVIFLIRITTFNKKNVLLLIEWCKNE